MKIKVSFNKSLLQNQNNLSNIGTNFFLQQRNLQSFDKKISEVIPMDNCFFRKYTFNLSPLERKTKGESKI